jgi:uncharacterized membrane protein
MDSIAAGRPAQTYDASPVGATTAAGRRVASLDVVRGIVMVLMAIDHVRVYSGVPPGGAEYGVFFTRWITHVCAPAFVFLAGTAAFLHGRTLGDVRALARYLVTRGLLLVALEVTLIRFAWTFNVAYSDFLLAGVIWMLGWSMVLLAALVRFSPRTVGWTGVAIMALQQLFSYPPRLVPEPARRVVGYVWEFLSPAGLERLPAISILYVIVPWIGVMAAGYGFGTIILRDAAERRRISLRVGLGLTLAFVVIGSSIVALGPAPQEPMPPLLRLLDQRKYPPTQLYLAMTLGPTLVLIALAERWRGSFAGVLATFGRVPMFYYLLHIPLIHLSALLVNVVRSGATHQEWYARAPFVSVEAPGDRWSLGLLYLVFAIDVAILYPLCRWYMRRKADRASAWMRYI